MSQHRKRVRRLTPVKHGANYAALWRVVDGAINDAFQMHPDYLTIKGRKHDTARRSIAKRITGALLSFADTSAEGLVERPSSFQAERAEAGSQAEAHGGPLDTVLPPMSASASAVGEHLGRGARP